MVRERLPECVVVMFTGTGTEEVAVEAMKAGLDDYVVKRRNHLPRLVASIRSALDRADTRRALRASQANHQAAQEEKGLLLEELYHRLHNNLQIVASLITFSARSFSDPAVQEAFTDIVERIHSLTLLQERLYRSRDLRQIDMAGYLEDLVSRLILGYDGKLEVALELVPLALPLDRASPVALLVNELLLDAVKRAVSTDGKLRVRLALTEERTEMTVIVIGSAGRLLPEDTLSFQIASRLARQVKATVNFSAGEPGSTCTVILPPVDMGRT
ncbi:histidine kinase dimerization/phosphoacceptor domain -containing protein [Azospirillum sp. A29]|jgi:two-component sensor histidine kinase